MKKTPALQFIGLGAFLGGEVAPEKAPAKTRRLLNGPLYAGDWVFVHGNKADANSVVATAFAVLLAGGHDRNGKISSNKSRPVLYLDSSNNAVASRQRMRALVPPDDNWNSKALYENFQISGPHIDPSTCGFNLNAPEDQQVLETMLLSTGSQPCLVLDELGHWLGDGSRRSFVSWLMNLKAQGVTVFLVSSGSKSRSAFALLEHAAQLVVEVEASAKKPNIKLTRPTSSTREPFRHASYELSFPSSEAMGPTFTPVARRKKTELSAKDIASMYAQVKDGKTTVRALADTHDVQPSTITKWFQKAGLAKLPVGRKPKSQPTKPTRKPRQTARQSATLNKKKWEEDEEFADTMAATATPEDNQDGPW
jgi:transposase-like protein